MLRPIRRKVKKKKVIQNNNDAIPTNGNFVHSEILRVLETYKSVIKGRITAFKIKFPILNNGDIRSEIEQTIILKITKGIIDRTIQLHKIEARQTNVLIQKIANNCIIDELRELEKTGGSLFTYDEGTESSDDKRDTSFISYIMEHMCPNKYGTCTRFDSPEFIFRMKEMHELILKELKIYDKKAYRLYLQILSGECDLKTNTPNIVRLRKEVKSIVKYYADK